jgi:hypothetical protein
VVELVEELLHLPQRAPVGVTERLDGGCVADAKAEDEPAGEFGGEALRRGAQPTGLPRPDIRDPGGHDQLPAARELCTQPRERIGVRVAAADPEGREPGFFDGRSGLRRVHADPFGRRHPDPHAAKP